MSSQKNVKRGLTLAVNFIMANEPGDSRAVSNEAVALAALSDGDDSVEVMQIIDRALEQGVKISLDGARVGTMTKGIDYHKILRNYMRYVVRSEGITYVVGMLGSFDPEQPEAEVLTNVERDALEALHREVKELEKDYLA